MKILFSFFILFFSHAEDVSVHFQENPDVPEQGVVYLKDVAKLEFLNTQDQESWG